MYQNGTIAQSDFVTLQCYFIDVAQSDFVTLHLLLYRSCTKRLCDTTFVTL